MNIVVITAGGLIPEEPLGVLPAGTAVRRVAVSGLERPGPDTLLIPLPDGLIARWARVVNTRARRSVVLRMLVRISPLDAGASFWRAVRRDARVAAFMDQADLLVAADRDANYACWHLARKTTIPAVSGYSAAKKELQRRTAE
ncbi:hypothetical protein [Microbacterium alcoholitolerans]|uniref:hypothetical protein n=1 Tax=unclassified Microbacterium TaxID=2609290 RepID=UPI003D16C993